MKLDNVFKKTSSEKKGYLSSGRTNPAVPEGLLRKCNKCGSAIIAEDVRKDHYICPKCGGYFRMHAYRRIEMIADEECFEEWDKELQGGNPLEYKGYGEKLAGLREKTGLTEAVVTGKVYIDGNAAAVGVCDGRFLMASMGEAVGEKITRAVERATAERLPVILFACSGGARMQEGIVSLMQMAKTSAALKRHSDAGLLYISVLTDPTMGGVTASFAMLGDIILAEPKALIGFAGPRVIEQTIRQKLPKGFQRADRPVGSDYIDILFTDFTELHGDRLYADDRAVIGGIARFHGIPVTVIAQEKGKDTKDNISRNFGMPSPEGYRKALRLMRQAEKFGRPVICFVDTPGAFCGLEAEERGQGEAIARNLFEMSGLGVPVLSVITGEGGSGGALAMALADEVWILENSVYSILSPEGFASILWKDSLKAKEAAQVMKLTAEHLHEMKIVERVFSEPLSYTRETMEAVTYPMEKEIERFLEKYSCMTKEELTSRRYERFRRM